MEKFKVQSSKFKNGIVCSLWLLIISCTPHPEIEQKPGVKRPEVSEPKKHYSFGYEYLKNKMYDDAIKNFELAIEESTSYVDAYVGLSLAYKGKNDYGEVERVCKKLIEIAPLQGRYALGKCYTEYGKYEDALSEYREALKIDSSYADAWYGIGYVYEKMGNIPTSIENYKQALKFDPKNESIRYNLAKAYVESGECEKAILELKALLAAHPDDLDVRTQLGCAYLAMNMYNEARGEFEYITKRAPSDITNRLKLGLTYEGLKDYSSAIKVYKEAISIDTMNIVSYCYLINLYIELGNLDKANELLGTAKRINPEYQLLHYLAGTIWVKKGDKLFESKEYDASISNYSQAIAEYKLATKGEDQSLVGDAKKAIESANSKIKRAKEEKWWRH
ncbi:MAG: tetratricopeptide repeat protein [bacterium]|nr:tetratricopeptide repeat protein [bacterium]